MIHYHGLPMTTDADMVRAMRGRHAMVSYARPDQIEAAAEICQSVALDNGAFSAWRNGTPFDAAGYAQWAAHWIRHPAVDWCVIPDVIDGDAEANDALLATWPLSRDVSVPVYHLHEPVRRLVRLCAEYPRVALGSSGAYAEPGTREWWSRLAVLMACVCDDDGFPRVRLHGLRMLDPVIFSHLPLASADSCNVARNIGIDERWHGPYVPRSRHMRALIILDRIEAHASARRWCKESSGVQQNLELLG